MPDVLPSLFDPGQERDEHGKWTSTGKVNGHDLTDEIRSLVSSGQVKTDNYFVDEPTQAFAALQGFNALPRVVSKKEMDDLVDSGATEVWRGVSGSVAQELIDDFHSGDYKPGKGTYGNGFYFSVDRTVAMQYADGEPDHVFRGALHPDAKIVKFQDVRAQAKQFRKDNPDMKIMSDFGRYAAMLGYDAIQVDDLSDGADNPDGTPSTATQYVVLNRSAMILEARP